MSQKENFLFAAALTILILFFTANSTPWGLFALAVPLVMVSPKPEK